MLQYEVLKHELNEKQAALDELKDALGLERLREEVEMLENKAAEPGFYDNMESAQKILQWVMRKKTFLFCRRHRRKWRPSEKRLRRCV